MQFIPVISPSFLFSLPGGGEWILILVVVLLLFGAKRIPDLARGLGRGIREFKDASREIQNEINSEVNDINKTLKP